MATVGEAPQASGVSSDSNELAGFGYKQELDRSLGSFSAFAAGFSYISILTGVTALYGFGYLNAGPGRVVDVAGRGLRADPGGAVLHGDGGSVPDRRVGLPVVQADPGPFDVVDDRLDLHRRRDRDDRCGRGRLAGRAAPDHDQVPVLRHVRRRGHSPAPRTGRRTLLLLGAILVAITTIINMLGVKLMSRINNVGVIVRAGRLDDAGHPAAVPRPPRRRRSSSTPTATAPAIPGATSARCSSAAW